MSSKKLRFDEENIRHTNHPPDKDYGLMSIPESKTPFPRHADPVEAKELYRRMQEDLQRANMLLSRRNTNDDTTADDSCQRTSREQELRRMQRAEFLTKRKQFYQSEFLIAKQKKMSKEIHPPGPSVGSNWRIDDADEQPHAPSISSVQARYTLTINRHRLLQSGSFADGPASQLQSMDQYNKQPMLKY